MQHQPGARRRTRAVVGAATALLLGLGSMAALGEAFAVPPSGQAHRAAVPAAACRRVPMLTVTMAAATPRRTLLPLFPWRRRRPDVRVAAAADDVGSDPSGATLEPKAFPPIEPAPQGPNPKAIFALVAGELLLGLLAFPIGYAFKINPLGSIRNAFSAGATAAVGGLGPALLNALGISVLLTLPALLLHKVSGETIEDMLRESLAQIFGSPESTRRRPALMLAISLLLSLSAGLGEELLFRGALQPLVASFARSDAVGVGLSSLVFAVLHAATPRYLLLAFVLSVYLGWIQLSTANLLIPIAVHTLFDVVGFALSLFDKKKSKAA